MLWISRILSFFGGPPLQLPPLAQLFLRDLVSTNLVTPFSQSNLYSWKPALMLRGASVSNVDSTALAEDFWLSSLYRKLKGRARTMTRSRHTADLRYSANRSIQNIIISSRDLGTLDGRLGLTTRNSQLQRSTSLQDNIVGTIKLIKRMFVVIGVSLDAVIADRKALWKIRPLCKVVFDVLVEATHTWKSDHA
ncbi:hypothetical protein KCU75_g52, partial [Aureobasidium melanogenum]